MAIITRPQYYIDANIFIYAAEKTTAFTAAINQLFERIAAREVDAVTSEITLAEVIIKPLRDGRQDQVEGYQKALQTFGTFALVPVSRDILVQAAVIRAATNLPLLDAIHAATALATRCTRFFTNDDGFRKVKELKVHLLSEVNEEE